MASPFPCSHATIRPSVATAWSYPSADLLEKLLGLADPAAVAAAAHPGLVAIVCQCLFHDLPRLACFSRLHQMDGQQTFVLQRRHDPGQLPTASHGSGLVSGLLTHRDEQVPGLVVLPAR